MIPAETCRRTGYTRNDGHNDAAVPRLLSFSSHRTHFEYTARLSALKRHPFYYTLQRRPPRPAAAQVPYHHNTIPPHHHTPTPAGRPDGTPDAAPDATGARVAAGPRRRWRRRWRDAGLIPSPRLQYQFAVPVYSARLLAGL